MRPTKHELRSRRKRRIRARVVGTAARPRLTVTVSLTRVSAQIIDDTTGRTLAAATSGDKGKNVSAAAAVGTAIAEAAKSAKVDTVVFDRNGRTYHGRIKALADAARAAGLRF